MLTKIEALKEFFSVPGKPITNQELIDLRTNDPHGFNELAQAAREALADEVSPVAIESAEAPAPDALTVGELV